MQSISGKLGLMLLVGEVTVTPEELEEQHKAWWAKQNERFTPDDGHATRHLEGGTSLLSLCALILVDCV